MTARDRKRLGASDWRLIAAVEAILLDMEEAGHEMFVTSGARTTGEQILLWKQGRETPGPVVTRADGIHVKSQHQAGRAADLAFRDDEPYAERHPWLLYGETAERHGLEWGGRWTPPDRPHCQLKVLPEGTLRA